MSSKILLTGATGFVGKNFLKSLDSLGIKADLIVRKNSIKNLPQNNAIGEVIETPDLFKHSTDYWEKLCKNYSTVVHLAWYTEPGVYLNSDKNIDCLIGSLSLIQGAKKAGVKKIVGAGTCLEYEIENKKLSSINTPLKPTSLYAGTKLALFYSLSQLFNGPKYNYLWCRLFFLLPNKHDQIIYGKNQRLGDYIKSRIVRNQQVDLTNGNQIRDYLYVQDATNIIANAIIKNKKGTINICSGIPRTVKEIAEEIAIDYGKRKLLKFGSRRLQANEPEYIVGDVDII
jgi:nucleoside-diphosphate-sugar epimerase